MWDVMNQGARPAGQGFVRRVLLGLGLWIFCGCAEATRPPNIVVLISDDQDFTHFGFAGHQLARTPVVDAMAASGVTFSHAYVPMSRCRPAQAALMSGQWPHQNGIYYNVGADHIDPTRSIANRLKDKGYECFGEGKFWEHDPRKMGFVNYKIGNYDTFARRGQEHLFEFLDARDASQPFLLWWAPELPHVPHNPPARLLDMIDPAGIEVPEWYAGEREEFIEKERASLAMGAWLDEAIGELRDHLESIDQLDNTLFLFLIDNGYANGQPSKGTAFEKGLRTPAILSGAGIEAAGQVHGELVSALDLYATLLDYASASSPNDAPSKSLRPLIEGQPYSAQEALYGVIYTQSSTQSDSDPARDAYGIWAVTKKWKYIEYLQEVRQSQDSKYHIQSNLCDYPERDRGDIDLFDLENDPDERRNLSQDPAHAGEIERLRQGALAWWSESGGTALNMP